MAEPSSLSSTEAPTRRGFWSLIVTQFQGAFSDNALKNLVIFLVVGMGLSLEQKHRQGELIGALFSLPFILFSMYGGFLADRFSKRTISIGVKVFEVFVMLLATIGLARENLTLGLTAVFLMGVHSAFFGPSKYGLLPELLPECRLSWGNGILELGTFMAIILGGVAAGFLSKYFHGHQQWSGVIFIGLALFGFVTSLGISRVPAANPHKKFRVNFLADLVEQIRLIRQNRVLALAMIGNTYFNFIGALILLNIFFYGADVLHVDEVSISLMSAALAVGIGAGSFSAGYLSGGKIEYGLVPLGAMGLTLFSGVLALPQLSLKEVFGALALLGFFGGFFIVPICAVLQHQPAKEAKGAMLATANLLSFVGIFLASGVHLVATKYFGFAPQHFFLLAAVMTLAGTLYVVFLLPDALLRFLLWMLTHTVYRIRVNGRDHIPAKGGALFVANHLSYVDTLLLMASTDRYARFLLDEKSCQHPLLKPFAKTLRVISLPESPRERIAALHEAREAICRGDVVCIFAEGQISRIGQMLPFHDEIERIMKEVEAPIIPVCLDDVWGSIFSFEKGRFLWKVPQRIPYPVTVSFGQPMPATASAPEVRQAVQQLQCDAWPLRRTRMTTLGRAFVKTARKNPSRFAMADARDTNVSFRAALARSVFLARRLKTSWAGQENVGILLPPSVGGALVNFAALIMGKVPVNLNYTVSDEIFASCIQQCNIQTILTSRAFSEKLKLHLPESVIYLEEITASPSPVETMLAFLMARWLPVGCLERAVGCGRKIELDDLATIIFSSGSTGDPKGVMLTHYNIVSNVEQLTQTFAPEAEDRFLGVLPFFHSFGFTGTLVLPACVGLGVVYHPNPLDAPAVGPLVREYSLTFLLATPTFLQGYLRRCQPEDFGSLRFVMVSAEKLPERVAQAFEEKFGLRPLEGYGCTECAPAVTVNTRDYRAAGVRQIGGKRGKIGHPLPGVCVRIVDPETQKPLPLDQPGLLLVRGPNVMKGYLGRPEKTAEVLRDGWYHTGDIATLDEDGFLQITDRLSRFSKIGGEMVPHVKVEEKLHEAAGVTQQTFAVTGLPDEKKGERLVVLHTLPEEALKSCLENFSRSDLPNLWKPRSDQFFHLESLPHLGTGKLDLRKIRELAANFSTSKKEI